MDFYAQKMRVNLLPEIVASKKQCHVYTSTQKTVFWDFRFTKPRKYWHIPIFLNSNIAIILRFQEIIVIAEFIALHYTQAFLDDAAILELFQSGLYPSHEMHWWPSKMTFGAAIAFWSNSNIWHGWLQPVDSLTQRLSSFLYGWIQRVAFIELLSQWLPL